MATITYTLTAETSGNESHQNYEPEAAHVKAALESAISDLKMSSGMAQITVTSLVEN